MATERVTWLMYLVGSLLVFGTWVDIVPTGLGWVGWLMAIAGWAVGNWRKQGDSPYESLTRADQIDKLDDLRRRNVITEQEFQREKQRLLDSPS
jgi:hypothetical protein